MDNNALQQVLEDIRTGRLNGNAKKQIEAAYKAAPKHEYQVSTYEAEKNVYKKFNQTIKATGQLRKIAFTEAMDLYIQKYGADTPTRKAVKTKKKPGRKPGPKKNASKKK